MRLLRVTVPVAFGFLLSATHRTIPSTLAQNSVRQELIGAWRLVSDEETVKGKLTKLDQTGILTYTSDGHISVQILDKSPTDSDVSTPVQYSANGYEAYFGTFDVNEGAHSVTHHVQGALVRSLIGKDLTRIYRFSGKQLVLTSSRPDESWRIVWEHY